MIEVPEYWPYGATRALTGTMPPDKQYTGQQIEPNDSGLGLYNYKARFYSTTLGRFLSVDPVAGSEGQPQSWNPYSYVRNRPLRLVDPSGLDPHCLMICTGSPDDVIYDDGRCSRCDAILALGGLGLDDRQLTALTRCGELACGAVTRDSATGDLVLHILVGSVGLDTACVLDTGGACTFVLPELGAGEVILIGGVAGYVGTVLFADAPTNPLTKDGREAYEEEVRGLQQRGAALEENGVDEGAVADTLVEERRAIRVKWRELTRAVDAELAGRMDEYEKYRWGDIYGPVSAQQMRDAGSSNREIIDSAARPGRAFSDW